MTCAKHTSSEGHDRCTVCLLEELREAQAERDKWRDNYERVLQTKRSAARQRFRNYRRY